MPDLRVLRLCYCPFCQRQHKRHLSDGDIKGLQFRGEAVNIVCAGCLGQGRAQNPESYQSWRLK